MMNRSFRQKPCRRLFWVLGKNKLEMAVWRSCLRASSSSSRHRFSTLSLFFFSNPLKPSFNPNPPPLFLPSPPCFSPLRRFISSYPEFPISSQDIIPKDDSSLPVLAVVQFLDGFHEFTGLPWWMIIASSTVAVRLALLPLLILQLKKLKTISELLPQC